MQAAAAGLNPAQSEYLRRVATAEQWKSFSIVARAPRMDYIGARYVVPFADSAAGWWAFPTTRYARTKELANAGVSRAAWHLSRGRTDSAEVALREVVSFGFVLIDNASSLIDELIGAVMIGIGRGGLIQFYKVTGDPRGVALQAQLDSVLTAVENRRENADASGIDLTEPQRLRDRVRGIANDEKTTRGLRKEMLTLLAAAPCTNARELIFGSDPEIVSSFAKARRTMARFPSDSAMLDLIERTPELLAGFENAERPRQLLVRVASIEGALLGNRRLLGCAKVFAQWGTN